MLGRIGSVVSGLAALLTATSVVVAAPGQTGSAHDFTFTAIDGKPLALSSLSGKVVLVVNTASLCGFTRQYEGLQKLHERYEGRGFAVLGVPSNDFGGQEPKSDSEIKDFCQGAFGVTFPLTSKVSVVGPQAHPFYAWARDVLGPPAAPRWNFHKYLVGGDGRLVASFGTTVEPTDKRIAEAVEAELAKLKPREARADVGSGPAAAVARP